MVDGREFCLMNFNENHGIAYIILYIYNNIYSVCVRVAIYVCKLCANREDGVMVISPR